MRRLLFYLWNFWPPFWGAGVHIHHISEDLLTVKVRLKHRPWTKNFVGTQFGGSIYAMTDPFYMVMLLEHFKGGYIVWDKASNIRFKKPGKSELSVEFRIKPEEIEMIKTTLNTQPKMDWEKYVLIHDKNGDVVAEVHKIIHIRKKESSR